MKLVSLSITNFRQFYSEQSCEFATGSEGGRVVTVFHGYNGSGKTALLNAFVWCLYGETTKDLEAPDKLENEAALAEAPVGSEVSVSACLVFDRPDGRYRIRRTRVSVKEGVSQIRRKSESLDLFRTNESGEMVSVEDTEAKRQKRIEQFLPRSLYPFFFFNGERVERIASPDAYDSVELGVKTLLDIAIYERGEKHLRTQVERELTASLQQLGDVELQRVAKELEDLDEKKEAIEERLANHQTNVQELGVDIGIIEGKQEKIQELAELAKERERLREDERKLGVELIDVQKRFSMVLSKNGYLAFSEGVLSETERLILDARRRGDIPAKIKPQFVNDLLSSKICICGTEILPGTAGYDCLVKWRDQTGLADLEEQLSYTAAAVGRLRERRNDYRSAVEQFCKDIDRLLRARQAVKSSLAVIDEKLGDPSHGEDAARLQEHLRKLQRDREQEKAEIIVAKRDLDANEEAQAAVKKKIRTLQTQSEKGALIKRQLEAVDHVADAIAAIGKLQKEDVRRSLDESIRLIWNDAAIKQYTASVTEDYRLLLSKQIAGNDTPVVGASTGEKQVLALSFVGSLVKKARENFGKVHGVQVGGYYPLVMDSPFGSLEDDYRAKVADWVPRLADQVIVLVSKSQWRAEVEGAMKDRIGKEYVLELHTSKEGSNRDIEIRGVKVPYVVSENDPNEKTIIREV
jgi:DNA sulfur modification protein DndD